MKHKFIFILILLLAICLRFYRLGSFPPGFTWDESAIGYNAYGILSVHRDEWLNRTPLSFRSFGDYKSPLLIYMVAASEALLGINELAVRFPVAVMGTFLVVGSYFLTLQLVRNKLLPVEEKDIEKFALVAMLLVSVSPWATHFSTIAFESMVAATLTAWATVFLLAGINDISRKKIVVSGALYALSLYAYHSAKLVVPLIIIFLLYLLHRQILAHKKLILAFFSTCLIVGLPIAYLSIFGKANERFFGSSVLLDSERHLKPVRQLAPILISNFLSHLSPAYLFWGGEQTFRQSNMKDGILSPAEGVLILTAILYMFRTNKWRSAKFIFVLIAISILPATLGNDVPHANRALLGLPWFQILAAMGFLAVWSSVRKTRWEKPLIDVVVLIVGFGLLWHQNNDIKSYGTSTALKDMQYGYKEAITYVREHESEVDKVFFTNEYGQAYIYLLFYKKMNPIDFRGGGLANYTITDHPWKDGAGIQRVMLVGGPNEFPEQIQSVKNILYPDGKIAFKIVKQ